MYDTFDSTESISDSSISSLLLYTTLYQTRSSQPTLKHKWSMHTELTITRALKCKPSAGDMIIKKPEE